MLLFEFSYIFFFLREADCNSQPQGRAGKATAQRPVLALSSAGLPSDGWPPFLTPETAGLAPRRGRDIPHQPGCVSGLAVCSASKHPCTDLHLPAAPSPTLGGVTGAAVSRGCCYGKGHLQVHT